MKKLLSSISTSVNNLTIIYQSDSIGEISSIDFDSHKQMANIKHLTIHLHNLTDLFSILPLMINIEEIHLSCETFDDGIPIFIPSSFKTLHIESTKCLADDDDEKLPKFQTLKAFLNHFVQLQSLTFIVTSIDKDFADINQINSLKGIFNGHLQYLIHITHRPFGDENILNQLNIIQLPDHTYQCNTTNPSCPVRFADQFIENNCSCSIGSNDIQMYNAGVLNLSTNLDSEVISNREVQLTLPQLSNLRQIYYYCPYPVTWKDIQIFSKVFQISPKLNYLRLDMICSKSLIKLLSDVANTMKNTKPLKQITHISCRTFVSIFHQSFLAELSLLLPNLKFIRITELSKFGGMFSLLILGPRLTIDYMQTYFNRRSIDLDLYLRIEYDIDQSELNEFQMWLNNKEEREKIPSFYFKHNDMGYFQQFEIWF